MQADSDTRVGYFLTSLAHLPQMAVSAQDANFSKCGDESGSSTQYDFYMLT